MPTVSASKGSILVIDVARRYNRIAPLYDQLAALWSGGSIAKCHRKLGERLTKGERTLFVGAGSGQDAAHAAERGVEIVLLDISPSMLTRAEQRVRAVGGDPELIEIDLREYETRNQFDSVVVSFFLNIFDDEELPEILNLLNNKIRPDGRLLVADFSAPAGSSCIRFLQRLYHDIPMQVFSHITGNSVHKIHRLSPALEAAGFAVTHREATRIFSVGPEWLEVIECRRHF